MVESVPDSEEEISNATKLEVSVRWVDDKGRARFGTFVNSKNDGEYVVLTPWGTLCRVIQKPS